MVQAADFNIDVGQFEVGLRAAKDKGRNPRALIAVDLFGLARRLSQLWLMPLEPVFVALLGALQGRSHCRLQTGDPGEGDSNFAVGRRDFEQIVPKVTID
jgi:hypothetical protein